MNDDTQKLIGTILTADAQRDCVHMALHPMQAGERLIKGAEIGLAYGSRTIALSRQSCYGEVPIGIVDPFLKDWSVKKGQWFFCWLFPGSVQGMRHAFHHPVLDAPVQQPASEAEAWLRAFAERWHFNYDEMIAGALEEEGYVVAMGRDLHYASELDPGDEEAFWRNVQLLTGKKFDPVHRQRFGWSCSC